MNRLDELSDNGEKARFAGRVDEAVLFYEEAYRLAIQLNVENKAIEFGLETISNLIYLGNDIKALNFIVEIHQNFDDKIENGDFIWLKLRYWTVLRRTNPLYDRLLESLEHLKLYSRQRNNQIISTVFIYFSWLYYDIGEFEESIVFSEKSWSMYDDDDEHEVVKHTISEFAFLANLKVQNLTAAERWLDLYCKEESDLYAKKVDELIAKINLSLYKGSSNQERTLLCVKLEDAISGFSEISGLVRAKIVLFRMYLLKLSLGDPIHALHPAKRILLDRKGIKHMQSFVYTSEKNLMRIDYRIACLRFILNIDPVDDYWYQFKQDPPIVLDLTDLKEIKNRIRKVKEAIKYAESYAADLDLKFKCTINLEDVQRRKDRLNEIITSLGFDELDSDFKALL